MLKPSTIAPIPNATSTALQGKYWRGTPVSGKRGTSGVATGISVATGVSVAATGVSVAATGVSVAATGVSVAATGVSVPAAGVSVASGMSVAIGVVVAVAIGVVVAVGAHSGPLKVLLINVTEPVCAKARPFKRTPSCRVMEVDARI